MKAIRHGADRAKRTGLRRKWVYLLEEGSAGMRDLLGGKGANLAEMRRLGPPSVTSRGVARIEVSVL